MDEKIKVLIADDHAIVRMGLTALLAVAPGSVGIKYEQLEERSTK